MILLFFIWFVVMVNAIAISSAKLNRNCSETDSKQMVQAMVSLGSVENFGETDRSVWVPGLGVVG